MKEKLYTRGIWRRLLSLLLSAAITMGFVQMGVLAASDIGQGNTAHIAAYRVSIKEGVVKATAKAGSEYSGTSYFMLVQSDALEGPEAGTCADIWGSTLENLAAYVLTEVARGTSMGEVLNGQTPLATYGAMLVVGTAKAPASTGAIDYDIDYYEYDEMSGMQTIGDGPQRLMQASSVQYLFADMEAIDQPVGKKGVNVYQGNTSEQAEQVDLKTPENGVYDPTRMAFPKLDVLRRTDAGKLEEGVDYRVTWSKITGSIADGAPTSAGTYTGQVSILNTMEYIQPSWNTVTYTIDKATPHLIVPQIQTMVNGSEVPSKKLPPSPSTGFRAQHSKTNSSQVPGAFHWVDDSAFSNGLTRTVAFTPDAVAEKNYGTAEQTYTFTMYQMVPTVTEIFMEQDNASGGIFIRFTEPTGENAQHIRDYTVYLYEKGVNKQITVGTVAKGAGEKGILAALGKVTAGKTYEAQIMSNSAGSQYVGIASERQGACTVEEATVEMTVGPQINLPTADYTLDSPENQLSITLRNTGTVTAVNLKMPPLDDHWTSTGWPTEAFTLAGGGSTTLQVQLKPGQQPGLYRWELTGLAGDNVTAVPPGTALAYVPRPDDAMKTVTVQLPLQPGVGSQVAPPTVTMTACEPVGSVALNAPVTAWTGKTAGTWSVGETPELTITLKAQAGFQFVNLQAEQIILTGSGASYATLENLSVSGDTATLQVRYRTFTQLEEAKYITSKTTAEGGVQVQFQEPKDVSEVSGYQVTLYRKGGTTPVAGPVDVAVGKAQASGAVFPLSRTLVGDGKTTYDVKITTQAKNPLYCKEATRVLTGLVKPGQPVLSYNVTTTVPMREGYEPGERVITLTLTNTSSLKAWGLMWPAVDVDSDFEGSPDGLAWDTHSFQLAPGESSERKLQLKRGRVAGSYTYAVTPKTDKTGAYNVTAINTLVVRQEVIKNPEYEPIAILGTTLSIPIQPTLNSEVTPPTGVAIAQANPADSVTLSQGVTAWTGKPTGRWSKGDIPRLTITLAQQPGFTIEKLEQSQVKLTGPGATRGTVEKFSKTEGQVTVTVAYPPYEQVPAVTAVQGSTTSDGGVKVSFTEASNRADILEYQVTLYPKGTTSDAVAPSAVVAVGKGSQGAQFPLSSTLVADGATAYDAVVTARPKQPEYVLESSTRGTDIRPRQATLTLKVTKPPQLTQGYAPGTGAVTLTLTNTDSIRAWGVAWPAWEEEGDFEPKPGGEEWSTESFQLAPGEKSVRTLTLKQGRDVGTYSCTVAPQVDRTGIYNMGPVAPQTVQQKVVSSKPTPPSGGGGGGGDTERYRVYYDPGTYGSLTGKGSEQVDAGETPAAVPTVTPQEGWKFIGWSQEGKTELIAPETVKIRGSITFVAQYEAEKVPPEVLPPAETAPKFNREIQVPYIEGFPDGTFQPDQAMTRGQAARLLLRVLENSPSQEAAKPLPYLDMTGNEWYSKDVGYLTELGVLTGGADGGFHGDDPLTRATFVTMLMRIDGMEAGAAAPFPDVGAEHWAAAAIAAAAAKGYVKGLPDGGFHPNLELSRAEAVTIINRVLNRTGSAGDQVFRDVPPQHWAYQEIATATAVKRRRKEVR